MQKLNKMLLGGVSMLAVGAMSTSALAQAAATTTTDTGNTGIETVVVTGIRASLQSSQDIKRRADVFVDSITAEDIGALPDRSVTETLQRVPGVSINRFQGANDPDHFSAEGAGVQVRGLTYVRGEFNSRDTFSANNGRELSFADVPSELLRGVDVFKTPSADMIEGGISGTVNLRTLVPFDSDGFVAAGTIEGSYGDFEKKWKPTFDVLLSDRWKTPIGEFGLLGMFVDSQLATRADNVQTDFFTCRTSFASNPNAVVCPNSGGAMGVWMPNGANIATQEFERKRLGYAGAAQWQSNDGTALATLQFLRSDSRESWTEHRIETAADVVNGNGGSFPLDGTEFGVSNDGVFSDGIITGPTGWRDDGNYNWRAGAFDPSNCSGGGCDPRTPLYGLQTNNHTRNVDQKFVTSDYGANLKWNPTDSWSFNVDYQHVDSTVEDSDDEIAISTYQDAQLGLHGSDLPDIHFLPPGRNATDIGGPPCTSFGAPGLPPYPTPFECTTFNSGVGGPYSSDNPNNNFWRSAMDHTEDSEGKEDAVRFDVDYKFQDQSWLQQLSAGYRWSQRDQTTRSSVYNWGVMSEQWGNGGPVWLNDPVDGIHDANGYPTGSGADTTAFADPFGFSNYFRGKLGNPITNPYLFPNSNGTTRYADYVAFANSVVGEWKSTPLRHTSGADGWVPLVDRFSGCDSNGDVHMIPGVGPTYLSDPAGTDRLHIPGCEAGYIPSEVNTQNETTHAIYGMLKFEHQVGDGTLGGNLGVRWVRTEHSSEGAFQFPLNNLPREIAGECLPDPMNPGFVPPPFCSLPTATKDAARAFAQGNFFLQTDDNNYDYFLPSLNVKYGFYTDNSMIIRAGISRTISRPAVGLTKLAFPVLTQADVNNQWGGFAFGNNPGNPFLKPVRATNFDLDYEWYFGPSSYFSIAGFYKELKGVVTQQTAAVDVVNPVNGQIWNLPETFPINSEDTGTVKGIEVSYQQFYDFLPSPFDGLGLNANFTYIESQGVAQQVLNLVPGTGPQFANQNVDTSQLPLEQLSKYNVNITGIYEKGPISFRLAYNWRSKFLLTARDVINPYAPIMQDDTGTLDGSFFYSLNDHIKIGLEGSNLTDTVIKTEQVLQTPPHGPMLLAPRSWYITDRRVTLSIRAVY